MSAMDSAVPLHIPLLLQEGRYAMIFDAIESAITSRTTGF